MDPRIRKAVAMIKADIRRDISQEQLAQDLNVSYSRLRHLFKDEAGYSPRQYLKKLRMQRAKHLLENTFLNVKQIMMKVGIKDHSHFVRDFKKAYGFTPTQYREYFLKQVVSAVDAEKSQQLVATSANV